MGDGLTPKEIRHAVPRTVTTLGLPVTVRGMTWAEDILEDRALMHGSMERDAMAAGTETRAFSGAVLGGGKSSRFGSDKCRHAYRGQPLIEHALASLADAAEVMVVGTAAPAASRAWSVPDVRPGFGPLSGMHAALQTARYPWVAVTACDMPFVDPAWWRFLLARADGVQMVVPASPKGVEPLAGIYRRELVAMLDARMSRGHLAVRDLHGDAPSRVVPVDEYRERFPAEMFVNVNRPEDLP